MTFADPLGLIVMASVGVLILYYLRERRRQTLIAPSLLLWQHLRRDVLRARRFRPDWLFLLQLLALIALSVGLAQPILLGAAGAPLPRPRVLVLDTTASTQARDVSPSRFEAMRGRALALLQEYGPEDDVTLIAAGARARVVVAPTRDHTSVAAALRQLVPSDTGGDLRQALQVAADVAPEAEIEVLSDANGAASVDPLPPAAHLTVIGKESENLGIASLQVEQGRFDDFGQARVVVQVQNYGRRDQHALLAVSIDDGGIL